MPESAERPTAWPQGAEPKAAQRHRDRSTDQSEYETCAVVAM
jgi:hypothetical protein